MNLSDICRNPKREGLSARLMAYLAYIGPNTLVSWDEIGNLFWGFRPDGGPEQTKEGIGVALYRARKRLRPEWKIKTIPGFGVILTENGD